MKRIAWTTNYRPFILGGNVHAPIKFEVDATNLFDLGKGYKGFMFTTPKGKTLVCESETGAIVGATIEKVKEDIELGDKKIMRDQIKQAKKLFKEAYFGDEEEFWNRLDG